MNTTNVYTNSRVYVCAHVSKCLGCAETKDNTTSPYKISCRPSHRTMLCILY